MNILLINPPYQTLTSNLGVGHQIPLGLLMVGGPLIDAGHRVRLLDAERRHLDSAAIARAAAAFKADVVLTGHAGSTPAHPVCIDMLRRIKAGRPDVLTIYGGVYPTYHARAILDHEPAVDVIVRGEGEAGAAEVVAAFAAAARVEPRAASGRPTPIEMGAVPGIAFRGGGGGVIVTPDRPPIRDLDAWRIGWELIENWDDYTCFGLGRAAIIQFSRGCPHRCTYCGQHEFWIKWRRRDPARLVDEIEWLHRTHGVRFITLADENPTTLQAEWRRFLELMAERNLPVWFFATIRATDIVRDADLMPLYRKAGILYVLMGIESTSDVVLKQIRKGSTTRDDLEACRLLKRHGIFSILGHIVGFQHETPAAFRAANRQLALYEGDYLNAMYVTPHDWTPFGQGSDGRPLVEPDQRKWDYRHQVLAQDHLSPWRLFLAVKWMELRFHLRPRRVWSMLTERDSLRRQQLRWCLLHIGSVWCGEIIEFLLTRFRHRTATPRVAAGGHAWIQTPRSPRTRGAVLPLPVFDAAHVTAWSGGHRHGAAR